MEIQIKMVILFLIKLLDINMEISINSQLLEEFYLTAIYSYYRCIEKKENSLLSDEIGISLNDLKVEKDSIKIKFLKIEQNTFSIEIKLNLSWKALDIGYYTLELNNKNKEIDNFLVFY